MIASSICGRWLLPRFPQEQAHRFYEAYSTVEFAQIFARLKLDDFVPKSALEIVQPSAAQMGRDKASDCNQLQLGDLAIVQPAAAQLLDGMAELPTMLPFLALITFTNHTENLA